MSKRILFVAGHPLDTAPGQRFRFEQYLRYLTEQGYQCDTSFLLSKADAAVLYKPGYILRKAAIVLRSIRTRIADLLRADQYDIIFIQREALMLGTTFFERGFARSRAKVIFDFDDAIWIQNTSSANRMFAWMKGAEKTSRIIAMSDLVFAGNRYLADYASRFNKNVVIIPTTIDTDEYRPAARLQESESVCIGWSGSLTTIQHLRGALPVLADLKKKYGARLRFEVIGDENFRVPELGIQGRRWTKEDELQRLSAFDIGIMPLPDDRWAEGKCGLKGLQYMALGIPTIMTPVGVNSKIISDGQNGFLAGTPQEWFTKLSALIDDPGLRSRIGRAGRQTVVDEYSTQAQKGRYVEHLEALLNARKLRAP